MRFQDFVLAVLTAGAVANAAVAPRYDPATACAVVSSSAAAFLAASPKATPTIDAQLGHDCLNSVPLHARAAKTLVEALLPFVEFQSTTEYLKAPPKGYTEPAADLPAGFAAVLANISSGAYKTEYEFQASLWKLVNSAHDGHFRFLPDLLSKAIGFRRPFPVVSVSLDGVSSPKIYSYNDILISRNSSFAPSALETIDGESATKFVKDLSQLGALNDPDALYNSMFFSPAFLAVSAGWQGYFAGSGRFSWIYPGSNTSITFENGTDFVISNKAVVIGDFTGVTDGESFFQKFCTGPLPTSATQTAPNTTTTATATGAVVASGYPLPVFISADKQVSGYYLPNSDVAVLSMISFEPTVPIAFQQTVQKFLAAAKADGKTKLVIDLAANGGGLIFQGYDTFRQLFPHIVQDGNTRFRNHAAYTALAQAVSSGLPSDFNPYTSPSDLLINLWQTPFNYKYDINITNSHFLSPKEKFGPATYNNDNFTNIIRWNFNDDLTTINSTYGVGEYITGYSPLTSKNVTQPFLSSDIVMIYDGYCASTCTIFSEFMRLQGKVKSIAYGGRPNGVVENVTTKTPIIQAIGGVKGANNWGYAYINYIASGVLEAFNSSLTAQQRGLILALTSSVPGDRSTDTSLNVRDNILPANIPDGTPSQFIYEPADCRLFYTPAMMRNVTAIWEAAARVTWGGDEEGCVAGGFAPMGTTSTISRKNMRENGKTIRERGSEVVGSENAVEWSGKWGERFSMSFPK